MSETVNATRAYHHGDLRQAALDAVVLRLRSGEVALPTIRQIAAEIGVTHRALYRYFADKSELKAAVAGEGFELLTAAMTREANMTARSVMEEYVRFAMNEAGLYQIMFSLESRALMQEAPPGPSVRRLIAIVSDAFAQGEVVHDTRNQVVAAWGMAHGLCELWRNGALRAKDSDHALMFILSRLKESNLI